MNDDVKKALEMVPHGHKADHAQLWAHLKVLAAHVDAEPVRLAAAREEQRETLGLDRWPTLIPFVAAMARKLDANRAKKGGRDGWQNQEPGSLVRRVIEEAEELEHAVDTKGAREILLEAADVANMAMMVADASGALDATPLTATPLADRIAELERQGEVVRRELAAALEHIDRATADWVDLRADAEKAEAERDDALSRVKELEAQLGGMTEQWKAELNHANAWMRKYRASEAERDALKAQLADAEKLNEHYVERIRELQEADAMTLLNEAVEMLRNIVGSATPNPGDHPTMAIAWTAARAFLAKVKS